jgi:hypothetical protein
MYPSLINKAKSINVKTVFIASGAVTADANRVLKVRDVKKRKNKYRVCHKLLGFS